MFHDLLHFLGHGGEKVGGELQFSAFTDAVFIAVDFRNDTFQLERIGIKVDFQAYCENKNNDDISENTGFEHRGCIYIMREYYSIQINPFVVSGGGGCVLYVFYECGGDVNVVFVTDAYYRHHYP